MLGWIGLGRAIGCVRLGTVKRNGFCNKNEFCKKNYFKTRWHDMILSQLLDKEFCNKLRELQY